MRTDVNWLRSTLFAIALGFISGPLQSYLFLKIDVVIPVATWLVAHDLRQYVHPIARVSDWIFWFTLFGILLGTPLGLIVRRNILLYWLIYWISETLLSIVLALWEDYGLGIVLVAWRIPAYWINLLGVLCFAYVAATLRAKYGHAAPVAP